MQRLNLPTYSLNIKSKDDGFYIFDQFRKKWLVMTPEEWVRQNFLEYLVKEKQYPASLISVEKSLTLNKMSKRADALIYSRNGRPIMLVEFKAPEVKISQNVFDQIGRYNLVFGVDYLLVSNGMNHFCSKLDYANQTHIYLESIPDYNQL